jgi:hypothetical protein
LKTDLNWQKVLEQIFAEQKTNGNHPTRSVKSYLIFKKKTEMQQGFHPGKRTDGKGLKNKLFLRETIRKPFL